MPGVLDSFRLDGRVACITGTTRGIGQTAALALAEAGCDIVHIDRRDPAETRARIEALGRRSALVELDLEQADADACERASNPPRPRSGGSTCSSTRPRSWLAARCST